MAEVVHKTVKQTQEQAVAAWIGYLNQIRLDELVEKLNKQDINLEEALKELEEIKQFLADPSHILGSTSTKHGEIAEHMQVNFENARRAIQGLSKNHTFEGVGRTAPEDYLRDGNAVQSKFYNGLKNTIFGKHAILQHLEDYPDFIKNGGSYDIPKDQYENMVELLKLYENNPSRLSTSDYYLAKKIDEFLKNNGLELGKDINPAVVRYDEAQLGTANNTVNNEEKSIKEEDVRRREKIYKESKPTLKEGMKAVGVSAAVEGGVAFAISVAKKRKEKNFSEFSVDDWNEIGVDTGKNTLKGGIRGGAIYLMSNFSATPANVASAYVTAVFGVAAQVKAFEEGRVSEEDFVINCETVCLDVTVSAIASIAGQVIIPIPILGAVIGSIAGEFVYELCKKHGTIKSQKTVQSYNLEMENLQQQLDVKFLKVILEIQSILNKYKELEQLAFDKDVNIAFDGSIKLAREVGVAKDKVLKSKEEIDDFFLL